MRSVSHECKPALTPGMTPMKERVQGLRISIVSDAIASRNGVGTYYQDLMEHLGGSVAHVGLISPAQDRDKKMELFSLPLPGDTTQRLIWPRWKSLVQELDRQDPNVIIIPSLGACAYFGLRYAKPRNIPVVVVCHTNFDRLVSLYWPGMISRPLQYAIGRFNRWLTRQAALVAALGTDGYDEAKGLGIDPDSIRIMGTPVSASFLQVPIVERSPMISRAIFVGRLAVEKSLDQILETAVALPSVQFAIAGDGPGRRRVEKAAEELPNVEYLGWLSRSQVLAELDNSDVLLLPSAIESFGTVALEALARRRFVIVRPECGIAKWPSLACGLNYIEPGGSLTDALRQLVETPEVERTRRAEESWDAVRNFNRHTVRLWLEFLADAAESPTASADESES